ncbi:MAG: DUF3307 domain-containing protein [Pyrinomonadaceae bacterium]|nr:DUF3307 domain-containing protein [Sphingobacteriaceae bacterium]
MDILLIKLFVAHMLGDFFLQWDSWVKEKEEKKLRSSKLYLHILIHGILLVLLLWNIQYWLQIAILVLAHGLIDGLKLVLQTSKTKRAWFFADQFLHVISILIVWYLTVNPTIDLSFLSQQAFWIISAGVLTLTFPLSITIKMLIAKWTPNATPLNVSQPETSLQSAGKYIGIMERLLVFIFIYTQHFEAIGFLLAAKSIFRFGDLKEGNDLKLTEYILIGTLLSFGTAIVISLIIIDLAK